MTFAARLLLLILASLSFSSLSFAVKGTPPTEAIPCDADLGGTGQPVSLSQLDDVLQAFGHPDFDLRQYLAGLRSIVRAYDDNDILLQAGEIDALALDTLGINRNLLMTTLEDLEQTTEFLEKLIHAVAEAGVSKNMASVAFPASRLELKGEDVGDLINVDFPKYSRGEPGKQRWLAIFRARFNRYLEFKTLLSQSIQSLSENIFKHNPPALARELLGKFDALSVPAKRSLEFDESEIIVPEAGSDIVFEESAFLEITKFGDFIKRLRSAPVERRGRILNFIAGQAAEIFHQATERMDVLSGELTGVLSPDYDAASPRARDNLRRSTELSRYRYRLVSNLYFLLRYLCMRVDNMRYETDQAVISEQIESLLNFQKKFSELVFGMTDASLRMALGINAEPFSTQFIIPREITETDLALEYISISQGPERLRRAHEALPSFVNQVFHGSRDMDEVDAAGYKPDFQLVLSAADFLLSSDDPNFRTEKVGLIINISHDDGGKIEMMRVGDWAITRRNQVIRFAGAGVIWDEPTGFGEQIPFFDVMNERGEVERKNFRELQVVGHQPTSSTLHGLRRYSPEVDERVFWDQHLGPEGSYTAGEN